MESKMIHSQSTAFGNLMQLQYGVSADIKSEHLTRAKEAGFWDRYQILLFKDDSNNIIVMEASLWHRLWATLSSLFCFCCCSYSESLTGVQATLITADDVRKMAITAKTADTVAGNTLDTHPDSRPKTPEAPRQPTPPIGPTVDSFIPFLFSVPPNPPSHPASLDLTLSQTKSDHSDIIDEVTKAFKEEDWPTIVDVIKTAPISIKDELTYHILVQFEDNEVAYWNLWAAYFHSGYITSQSSELEKSLIAEIEAKLYELETVVYYAVNSSGHRYCGALPKKLVDIVLGEEQYKSPLNHLFPYFQAMLDFRNTIQRIGLRSGMDILTELSRHLQAHPTGELQYYLDVIRENIRKSVNDPNSKIRLTEAEREKFLAIETPLEKLIKSCNEAATPKDFLAILKQHNKYFVSSFADRLLDRYVSIVNQLQGNEQLELRLALSPYFNDNSILADLDSAEPAARAIKILEALRVANQWSENKILLAGQPLKHLADRKELVELFEDKQKIHEMITLPGGMETLHFLWVHCNASSRIYFLWKILNTKILEDQQMRMAVLNFCSAPQSIEEDAPQCEETLIKILEMSPLASRDDQFWTLLCAHPKFTELKAKYEELKKTPVQEKVEEPVPVTTSEKQPKPAEKPVPAHFVDISNAIATAEQAKWPAIVGQIIALPEVEKDLFAHHVLKVIGNDVSKLYTLYCALVHFKPVDLHTSDAGFIRTIVAALLEKDIFVFTLEDWTGIECARLPKKLVDIVLGQDYFLPETKKPFNSFTTHFEAMIDFRNNIQDRCGDVAGFELLVQLTEHQQAHPSEFLDDYLMGIFENSAFWHNNAHSKARLEPYQIDRLLKINTPVLNVFRLIKACQEARTAEAFIAALKQFDTTFARLHAYLVRHEYEYIRNNLKDEAKDKFIQDMSLYEKETTFFKMEGIDGYVELDYLRFFHEKPSFYRHSQKQKLDPIPAQ